MIIMNQILRCDLLPERALFNPAQSILRTILYGGYLWWVSEKLNMKIVIKDKQDKTFVINPPDICLMISSLANSFLAFRFSVIVCVEVNFLIVRVYLKPGLDVAKVIYLYKIMLWHTMGELNIKTCMTNGKVWLKEVSDYNDRYGSFEIVSLKLCMPTQTTTTV